jgi:integrase
MLLLEADQERKGRNKMAILVECPRCGYRNSLKSASCQSIETIEITDKTLEQLSEIMTKEQNTALVALIGIGFGKKIDFTRRLKEIFGDELPQEELLKRIYHAACVRCDYQIKKASNKVYWVEYWHEGRPVRERVVAKDRKTAEIRLGEVEKEIREKRYIRVNRNVKTDLQTLSRWYLGLREVKNLSSYSTLKARLKNVLRILGKKLTIEKLNKSKVRYYRETRGQEPSARRRDQLTKVATINKEVSALKTMLNAAQEEGEIESNPIKYCKMETENNVRERVLTEEEFERLLNVSPEYLKPVLITAFYEPMRKSEIIGLTWDEIDINKAPGFIRLPDWRTKGGKAGRAIPLHPRVRKTLMKLPSRFLKGRVFLKDGKPFNDFKRSFATAKKDAGIDDFLFHDFRHCAVTNLRKAGNDYSTIMKASGHKTMSMFSRYNLVDEEDVAKIRWKGEQQGDPNNIRSKLIAAGMDPDEVKNALIQEQETPTSQAK